ncbi:unnamed protein product [Paramecium pentaurelia]|uniref:Uncharacterized protein n=1 Tax=Paramecium pentaurelia TaxID=43138 RepID=A0A8S1YNU7_9CILI|nr:unnamed protein product [Paramecium pentaurelia]
MHHQKIFRLNCFRICDDREMSLFGQFLYKSSPLVLTKQIKLLLNRHLQKIERQFNCLMKLKLNEFMEIHNSFSRFSFEFIIKKDSNQQKYIPAHKWRDTLDQTQQKMSPALQIPKQFLALITISSPYFGQKGISLITLELDALKKESLMAIKAFTAIYRKKIKKQFYNI